MEGIQAIQEMLIAIQDLGVVVKQVLKDGKIDVKDVATVFGLVANMNDFMNAVKDASMVPKEVKELNDDQVKAMVETLLKVFHTIKEA